MTVVTYWVLIIGIVVFWELSFVLYHRQIHQDSHPPTLTANLPTLHDVLNDWSEQAIVWTKQSDVAQYDPWRRRMILSRHWKQSWDLIAAHIVAHERSHANQSRGWVMLGGFRMIWAVVWGVVAGLGWVLSPGSVIGGIVAQWITDSVGRRRIEWDADQRAISYLTQTMNDTDRSAVITWGQQIAQNHRRALTVEGAGWSGLTLILAAVTHQIWLWTH